MHGLDIGHTIYNNTATSSSNNNNNNNNNEENTHKIDLLIFPINDPILGAIKPQAPIKLSEYWR